MGRTYGAARSVVKSALSSGVTARTGFPLLLLGVLIAAAPPAWAQGLPEFSPLNPMASSRSGLYYQPYRDPAPGRWSTAFSFDYASIIEYNRLSQADYVLDSELLRMTFGLSRDLGSRSFVTLNGAVGGVYAGFLDGFLDWYHGALGIRMDERERRPKDQFLYTVTLPDGTTVTNPMRVVPNGGGSELSFTLFRLPGVTAEAFQADAATVQGDLQTLKRLLEASPAPPPVRRS